MCKYLCKMVWSIFWRIKYVRDRAMCQGPVLDLPTGLLYIILFIKHLLTKKNNDFY